MELIAATKTIKYFTRNMKEVAVEMRIDNKTAISYINKKGGTKSIKLLTLALIFWDLVIERNLTVKAIYLPSKENVVADWLSRKKLDHKEWMLNKHIFSKLLIKWGIPQVDLFASEKNNQVEEYISWKWEKNALGTDAFNQDWNQWNLVYAFPDSILIGRVLKKLESCKMTSMILIAPAWTTATWYPVVMRMLVDHPWKLPEWEDIVIVYIVLTYYIPS